MYRRRRRNRRERQKQTDARDRIAPGIYGQQINRVADDAIRTLYPDLSSEVLISINSEIRNAFRDFANETKARLIDYVTDPENADAINFNAVGLKNPLPTMEVDTGEVREREEIIPPNLLEELGKDMAAPDPHANPETRTVYERETKHILHPDVEHGLLDFIETSQILMDAYDLTGGYGVPSFADDAQELLYDPARAFTEMNVDGLAAKVDRVIERMVAEEAQIAKEKAAEDELMDAGEPVAMLWDEMGWKLENLNVNDPDFERLVDKVNELERKWYDAQDADSADQLSDWIYNEIFLFAEDLADRFSDRSEVQDAIWETVHWADEASAALGGAADRIRNKFSQRASQRLCRSCRHKEAILPDQAKIVEQEEEDIREAIQRLWDARDALNRAETNMKSRELERNMEGALETLSSISEMQVKQSAHELSDLLSTKT